jgi:hypothetical protein
MTAPTTEATELEASISKLLNATVPGLPVEVAPAGGMVRAPDSLPAVLIRQRGATRFDTVEGTASGDVEVVTFWGEATDFAAEPVRSALRQGGDVNSSASATMPGGVFARTVTVTVKRLVPELPVLPLSAEDWRASQFAQRVAAEVSRPSYSDPRRGVGIGSGDAADQRSGITAEVRDFTLHPAATAGERGRRTVDVTLAVRRHLVGVTLADATAKATRAVEAMAGQFAPGLGRVESAEVLRAQPEGSTLVVSARLVLAFRLAEAA